MTLAVERDIKQQINLNRGTLDRYEVSFQGHIRKSDVSCKANSHVEATAPEQCSLGLSVGVHRYTDAAGIFVDAACLNVCVYFSPIKKILTICSMYHCQHFPENFIEIGPWVFELFWLLKNNAQTNVHSGKHNLLVGSKKLTLQVEKLFSLFFSSYWIFKIHSLQPLFYVYGWPLHFFKK